jgi:hypothetical protein
MINDALAAQLALELAQQYDFPQLFASFSWAGERMPAAWTTRLNLALARQQLTDVDYAQEVHRWGFRNRPINRAVLGDPRWPEGISSLLQCWASTADPLTTLPAQHALFDVLSIPRLGVATTSKWICFLDQSRFAIYDSRVAYALRRLLVDNQRVFPFVGGRTTPANRQTRVTADGALQTPEIAVTAYLNFVKVARATARVLSSRPDCVGWTPAHVDCCLFVAGESRLRDAASCRPLNHEINVSFV